VCGRSATRRSSTSRRRSENYRVSRSIRLERREHLVLGDWFGFSAGRRRRPALSLDGHRDLGIPASIGPRDVERPLIFQSGSEREMWNAPISSPWGINMCSSTRRNTRPAGRSVPLTSRTSASLREERDSGSRVLLRTENHVGCRQPADNMGWVQETRDSAAIRAAGWSGSNSPSRSSAIDRRTVRCELLPDHPAARMAAESRVSCTHPHIIRRLPASDMVLGA